MRDAVILVTGFGAFLDVDDNPSRVVARALADDPAQRAALGVEVVAGELPVVLDDVEAALDELLDMAERRGPLAAILALGVQRDATFRLERRARCVLSSPKPDNAGVVAAGRALAPARDLATTVALGPLAEAMRAAGAPQVVQSDDAGGYVCERAYHALLARAERRTRPAVFLHVPPHATFSAAEQVPIVAACLRALAAQALA